MPPKTKTSEDKEREVKRAVTCHNIRNIPRALKNAFKAKCALLGIGMDEVFIEFMRTKVQESPERNRL